MEGLDLGIGLSGKNIHGLTEYSFAFPKPFAFDQLFL